MGDGVVKYELSTRRSSTSSGRLAISEQDRATRLRSRVLMLIRVVRDQTQKRERRYRQGQDEYFPGATIRDIYLSPRM